jgi:hypothetical protein
MSRKDDGFRALQQFVGVGHSILHHHEENVVRLSDFPCGISHTANRAPFIVASILFLAACATTTTEVGQVREVAPGTYKIGVAGGAGSVVFGSHEAADAAVSQAGQYCHAKGQKLVILPNAGRDVVFRCGEKTTPGE